MRGDRLCTQGASCGSVCADVLPQPPVWDEGNEQVRLRGIHLSYPPNGAPRTVSAPSRNEEAVMTDSATIAGKARALQMRGLIFANRVGRKAAGALLDGREWREMT